MKKTVPLVVLAFVVYLGALIPASAQGKPAVATMAVSEIRPGMKGVALTVFQGTQPEPMEIEVLGVLNNAIGPKQDMILIRLKGTKPEYTGVVAGMSGSPVYVDGKLIGALAFRIGEFSKEPIAGVTPIAQMLEINELDRSVLPADAKYNASGPQGAEKTAGPGAGSGPLGNLASMMTPIETPLVFSGFTEDAVRRFGSQFASAGVVPVMGAGSVTDQKQPEPLIPGAAVSAVLVRGDLNIAATCTVTYLDADHLLACGHPLLKFGQVDIPMTKANVVATLPSPLNAFKIINTTEQVGSFVQDRNSGMLGRFRKEPDMIPVTLSVRGISRPRNFHYSVLNNARLTPVAVMATAYSILQGLNEYGDDVTYRFQGRIDVNGYPEVKMQDMFSPTDSSTPTAASLALSLGERFGRIYDNPYAKPSIKSVQLDLELVPERRWARLEGARTDITEARPGDDIVVEAALRPYRGERIVRRIPVRIPTSVPKGTLRILVSDGDTIDRMRRMAPTARRLDLASTISMLNNERSNYKLYVSLLEANPEAMVEDKIMPSVPLSIMNVMDGMRGTQDMVVLGESAVNEASTALDFVVSGAQIITLNVK
ncbi:MAG TPA: SpoIVB peptidase S55 domain-containing protein [Terriglobales bacterium]|nr:SpoIVB peptidase S55 domain-containing protein [Terriglobales bacterium]